MYLQLFRKRMKESVLSVWPLQLLLFWHLCIQCQYKISCFSICSQMAMPIDSRQVQKLTQMITSLSHQQFSSHLLTIFLYFHHRHTCFFLTNLSFHLELLNSTVLLYSYATVTSASLLSFTWHSVPFVVFQFLYQYSVTMISAVLYEVCFIHIVDAKTKCT